MAFRSRKDFDQWLHDWMRPILDFGDPAFPLDSIEDKHGVTIKADLPGVDKSDIAVNHTKNEIQIRASRPCFEGDRHEYYQWIERPCGRMERTIALTRPIDEDSIQAQLKDGVLTITAKTTTASSKHVDIL